METLTLDIAKNLISEIANIFDAIDLMDTRFSIGIISKFCDNPFDYGNLQLNQYNYQ